MNTGLREMPVSRWGALGFILTALAVGAVTYLLDAVGLIVLGLLVLLCFIIGWAIGLQRVEALWALFVASFALLPFSHMRVMVGTLLIPFSAFFSVLVIGIICLRLLITRDFRLEDRGILISLGTLLFSSTLSLMMAQAPDLSAWLLLKWFFHSALFLFLMSSFRNRVWYVRTLLTLVLVTGGLSAYGLFEYVQNNSYDVNFYAEVGTRQATGQHLALVLPLALCLGMACKLPLLARLLIWTSIGVSLIALTFTFSRGAWLAVLLGFLVLGFTNRRVLVFSMLGLFILALGYIGPQEVVDRFWSIFLLEGDIRHTDITNAQRLDLQWRGLKMILDHPILGVGLGNFAFNIPQTIAYSQKNPHNFYLTTWAEGWLLAFLGLLGVLYFVIKCVVRSLREASDPLGENLLRGVLGSLASLVTFMLFSDDLNHILTWTILGLSVGAAHLWVVKRSEDTAYTDSRDVKSSVRFPVDVGTGRVLLTGGEGSKL